LFKFKFIFNLKLFLFNFIYLDNILIFDKFNLLFIIVILLIGLLIIYYLYVYLVDNNYLLLVLIFILIIIILIFRINFLFIIVWWDLLGLISFLLIIYYNNYVIIKMRVLVMIFNRLGDIFILIVIFYYIINNKLVLLLIFNFKIFNFFILCLLVKRAQFPINLWLTKAIIAPLPISSLVHSSTLVTIGVFFIFRFNNYLNFKILEWFILFRLLYYSLIIINIFDIKKLMALSTINNLSLIIYYLYLNIYIFIYIYIIIHAIFKSIIFLCAGLLIYNYNDNQDIRCSGGLVKFDLLLIYFFILRILICSGVFYFGIFICKDLFFDLIYLIKLVGALFVTIGVQVQIFLFVV
jgi:NADH-ubiquinone oxidoreductase chain 5